MCLILPSVTTRPIGSPFLSPNMSRSAQGRPSGHATLRGQGSVYGYPTRDVENVGSGSNRSSSDGSQRSTSTVFVPGRGVTLRARSRSRDPKAPGAVAFQVLGNQGNLETILDTSHESSGNTPPRALTHIPIEVQPQGSDDQGSLPTATTQPAAPRDSRREAAWHLQKARSRLDRQLR